MANGTLKVSNIQTSSGSGTITLGQSGETINIPSGCTITNSGTQTGFGGDNKPYFHVKGNKTLTADNTTQKLDLDTTVIDSASLLDSSNNKLVIASAGKYFISYGIGGTIDNFADELQTFRGYLYKNGSSFYQAKHSDSGTNPGEANYVSASFVMDLAANDYLELYALNDVTGSNYCDCYEHLTGFKIIE